MPNRAVIAFEDNMEDGVQFTVRGDGRLHISCYCQWCGDTVSGFGSETEYTISVEEAKQLYKFLEQHIK